MFNPSSGNTVIKSKLISRRMFLLSAAKAVVMVGIVGRLVSLQINERTKYKTLSNLHNSTVKVTFSQARTVCQIRRTTSTMLIKLLIWRNRQMSTVGSNSINICPIFHICTCQCSASSCRW